jgi:hypothetical protein
MKAAIVPFLTSQEPVQKPANSNGTAKASNFKCEVCGGEAEYREGVSKKTHKPYKGVFCVSRSCDYARFW